MARVFVSHSSHDNVVAAKIFAWLREQGFEESFLDIDETAGLRPGSRWEQQLYEQLDRCSAALLLITPSWHASKWCFAEFVQARALGKAIFPVVVAATGDVLVAPDIQQVDLLKDYDGGLRRLGAELTRIALDAQGGFPWQAGRAPYPGMLAFERDDAAIYFGRDAEIRALVERLEARRVQGGARVVAVLAASGAGKSSLLRAGVLPRLARYSDNWVVVDPVRPGRQPHAELAKAIASAQGRGSDPAAWRALAERWSDANAFARDLDDLRVRAGRPAATVMLTIDQAEELFTVASPDEAERVVALLANAAAAAAPLLVVLTLRSDVLGRLQPLAERLGGVEEFSLAPLPLSRIGQIVDGPARVAGIAIGPGLVAAMTRDAADADALPLLAFALRELYDRAAATARAAGAPVAIGAADYEALGDAAAELNPLENAVRRRADAIVASLAATPGALEALREAFVGALARVDDQGRYSRRAAAWSEIDPAAHAALTTFVEARLLVSRRDDAGERIVEVAHEALLRKWPRLLAWLDLERDFLLGRQQVARALADWKAAPAASRDDALLQGLLLERARAWLARRAAALGDDERAFIVASAEHADAVRAHSARRRRNAWAAAAAAFVVVATLGVLAFVERRHSADLRVDAEADLYRQRSAAARDNGDPERAVMHALAAWKLRPDAKSRSALLQSALELSPWFAWEARPEQIGPGQAVATLAWTGDDRLVVGDMLGDAAVLSHDGKATVRSNLDVPRETGHDINMPETFLAAARLADGSVLAVLEDGRLVARAIGAAAFRAVGRTEALRSAGIGRDGTVLVQPQEGPLHRLVCAPRSGGPCGAEEALAYGTDTLPLAAVATADGRVAFAPKVGELQVVGADGAPRTIVTGEATDGIQSLAFQPGGRLLAVGLFSGRLVLIDAESARLIGVFGPDDRFRENAFRHVAWSPQGDRLASDCGLASACVWRLDQNTLRLAAVLAGHASAVNAVAWDRAGVQLASGDIDARVRVWRLPADAKLDVGRVALLYSNWAEDFDVSADGAWLVAGDTLGKIEVLDLATGNVLRRLAGRDSRGVRRVRLDPSRRWLASATLFTIEITDLAGEHKAIRFDPGATPETIAWDRQRPRLYAGMQDGTVRAIDVTAQSGAPETFPEQHRESVLALAVDPSAPVDRPTLYSADTLGVVLAHGGEHGPVLEAPRAASVPVGLDTLAFSRDGSRLVAAGNSPDVFVFDRASRRLLLRLETGADQVTSASLSPDGAWIAAADNGGRLYVWDAASGERWAVLDLRREPGRSPRDANAALGQLVRVAWLPDSKRIAVATHSGAVVLVPLDVDAAIARAAGMSASAAVVRR